MDEFKTVTHETFQPDEVEVSFAFLGFSFHVKGPQAYVDAAKADFLKTFRWLVKEDLIIPCDHEGVEDFEDEDGIKRG